MAMYKKSRNHLESVGESYWEHFSFAAYIAARMFGASVAIILHALVPAVFTHTGSGTIRSLHEEIQKRAGIQHNAEQ
jgi:hypothetical protein